jgi:hypothetical protein
MMCASVVSPARTAASQRLPSDGTLVHGRRTLAHPAIDGDLLPRQDLDDVSGLDFVDAHLDQFAVPVHASRRRRQVEQLLDRTAGTLDGVAFQQLGDPEQERDAPRLHELADRQRTDDGHRHQEVHVEADDPRRPQPLGEEIEAPYEGRCGVEDGAEIQSPGEPAPEHRAEPD